MRGLFSAVQFMTVLPLGVGRPFDARAMVGYFPVVGLLLGLLLMLFDQAALRLWSVPVASLVDVVLLVLLTGALHVDGLGDAADGLYGLHSREKALAIMKDSRVGVMGLTAILIAFALKWAGISGLTEHRGLLLLIIPAYARGAMVFGVYFLEYGRPGGGTGHALFVKPLRWPVFMGMLAPAGLSVMLGTPAVWLNAFFLLLTALILRYYRRRMGCITGDMLGAMTETVEALMFLFISIGGIL